MSWFPLSIDLAYHNVLYDAYWMTAGGGGKSGKMSRMTADSDPFEEKILDKAIRFQNQLISFSTGSGFEGGDSAYQELRRFFGARSDTKARLPDFVRRCRDLGQFWGWIKYERSTYAERRTVLWDAFHPLIDYLEAD